MRCLGKAQPSMGMRPIRSDLEELVPFIRAVIEAIRPEKPPIEPTPPERGVLPPQPYREGYLESHHESTPNRGHDRSAV